MGCNFPIIFDTYKGCTHCCRYCFTNFRAGGRHTGEGAKVTPFESAVSLERWCKGHRGPREAWCDWEIPLGFGRNTDPFQPCEKVMHRSLDALKVFAKYGYPFLLTTKGVFPAFDKEYRAVLKDCNVCWHESMCSPMYDKLEPGAPSFEKRLEAIHILSGIVPRVVVRSTPFFPELWESHIPHIRRIKEAGAYGILAETGQLLRPKGMCNTRAGRLYDYAPNIKAKYLSLLKEECHKAGLKFFCCDYKDMGDSCYCCGTEGMSGFTPNYANAAWYFFFPKKFGYTPKMKEKGTGEAFQNLYTGRKSFNVIRESSFAELMDDFIRKTEKEVFGPAGAGRR